MDNDYNITSYLHQNANRINQNANRINQKINNKKEVKICFY